MKCVNPVVVKQGEGYNKMSVPCGKCVACISRKRDQWAIRLEEELKSSSSGFFVTLTYDENNMTYVENIPVLVKNDLQLFLKRLRSRNSGLRYYAVGEYGSIGDRPHYHVLMFNLRHSNLETLTKIWGKGFVHVGNLNIKTIKYTTKYVLNDIKKCEGNKYVKQFSIMSLKPGIGYQYIEKMKKYNDINRCYYPVGNGLKKELPRFYKDRMYSKATRALLAEMNYSKNLENERRKNDELEKMGTDQFVYKVNEIENLRVKIKKSIKNNSL